MGVKWSCGAGISVITCTTRLVSNLGSIDMSTTTNSPLDTPSIPAITLCNQEEALSFSIPATANTLAGFRQWALSDDFPERGKITFVAGVLIVDMSPEPLEDHSDIKTEISRVLSSLAREQNLGRLHIDGVLITNKEAGVSNEPDILFLTKQTMKSGRVELTPAVGRPPSGREIVGTADWVLEIVSPSSVKKDKVYLRRAYYESGIGEYWIVDVLDDQINFELLIPGEREYVAVEPQDGWLQSPTFGRSFRLIREKDEDEFWLYTLQTRE